MSDLGGAVDGTAVPPSSPGEREPRPVVGKPWTFIALLLAAGSLRPAISVVGPVLRDIQASTRMSTQSLAMLTSLPVLCFGVFAPLAPRLARRLGTERTLAIAFTALVAGMVLRLAPGGLFLFGGTLVLGGGVALGNILLPAFVKRNFPTRLGLVTGAYTTTINLSAAGAAGAAAPLADAAHGSWRAAFSPWVIPAVGTLAVWLLMARRSSPAAAERSRPTVRVRQLLGQKHARRIVVYTASQAVIYYSVLAWLPYIYEHYGLTSLQAGSMLFVTTMVSAPVALLVPPLASRAPSQHRYVAAVSLFTIAGLGGILLAPLTSPYLWAVLLGVGLGGSFPLALTIFGLRTRTETATAELSMVAQGISYVVAAAGPLMLGALESATHAWTLGLSALLLVAAFQLISGLGAGRSGFVDRHHP